MADSPRPVFYVSGGTGITAEALGHSLLSQFRPVDTRTTTLPYVTSEEKVREAVAAINLAATESGTRPLVFSTLVNSRFRELLSRSRALVLDLFDGFMGPLEQHLGASPSHRAGQSHSIQDPDTYRMRIEALHFSLDNDDGGRTRQYDQADVILVGASRCGKTPTCLYMALQFGLRAANYPLTEEDFTTSRLPESLEPHKNKLFGLIIDADRLHALRSQRHGNSRYASMRQCDMELREVEALYQRHHIPWLDVTDLSIEEISTRILGLARLRRRIQ